MQANLYPNRSTWEGGLIEFLICCSILKRFCLKWKAFDQDEVYFISGSATGGL